MAKNFSYQQPANTSSMSSSYSVYNQPQQNTSQPQQNTSQPQRNNSQQSSYAAPQQQQQAAPLNMSAYSPQPQQAARIPSPGQAQGIEPRSNGTPYMPPGAVRETSDFLAPEVRARSAAQQARLAAQQTAGGGDRTGGFFPAPDAVMGGPYPVPQSPAGGQDAWNQAGRPGWDPNAVRLTVTGTAKDGTEFGYKAEADAYDRWRAGSQGNAQPNPTQPQQSPASGVEAWRKAGTPGFDPMGTYSQVTGVAKDGTKFGIKAMADAYDRWLEGSQGNAQPNPTQPPPNGRYGRPRVDPWMGATPENPAYDPAERAATAERIRQAQQPRFDTPPGVPIAEQHRTMEYLYPSAAPPRPAPQPGQNSYGFRGYDIDNGYSIRPEASPANAANFGGGPKPNLFSQSFTSPDGTTSDQPNFAQRDAFLNNLLDHDSENPGGMYQGSGRAPQSFMNPRPDIMGMWDKAGSMARDGWTNPVAGLLETRQPQRPNDAIGVPTSAPPPDPKQGRWPGQEFGQGPPREVSDAEVSRLADKIMSRDGYTGGRQRAEGTARAQLNGTWK